VKIRINFASNLPKTSQNWREVMTRRKRIEGEDRSIFVN